MIKEADYFYGWDTLCYASSSDVPSYAAFVIAGSYVARADGDGTTDYYPYETIKSEDISGNKETDKIIIMKFDVSAANSATIKSAKLHVYGYTENGAGAKQKIRRIVDDNWTETGITWNELPKLYKTSHKVTVHNEDYQWIEIGITDLVQSEIHKGDGILSLAIEASDGMFYMSSNEYNGGSNKAYIEIDFD